MEDKFYVLIIDDEEDSCILLHDILESKGLKVEYRVSGKEGLEYLEQHKDKDDQPGVVIMDMQLGHDMSGMDALKIIKSKYLGIQVIMVTGCGSFTMGEECLKNGAYDFLKKPVDMNSFIAKVMVAARKKK
jgi:DNA-binding NtrC family response regulator